MNLNESKATSGAGFAEDALPFDDLSEPAEAPFVVRDGAVYLRGSRSRSSGSLAFPERRVCLETGACDMEPYQFGPRGVLYSYSTVHVSSSRPVPYTLGYVDFPDGIRVLAHVRPDGTDIPLACDQAVELRADEKDWYVVPVAANGGERK